MLSTIIPSKTRRKILELFYHNLINEYYLRDIVRIIDEEVNGVKRESKRYIVVPYDIPEGNVATYFPEANALIPIDSFADKSKTPTSKSVVISLKKV